MEALTPFTRGRKSGYGSNWWVGDYVRPRLQHHLICPPVVKHPVATWLTLSLVLRAQTLGLALNDAIINVKLTNDCASFRAIDAMLKILDRIANNVSPSLDKKAHITVSLRICLERQRVTSYITSENISCICTSPYIIQTSCYPCFARYIVYCIVRRIT